MLQKLRNFLRRLRTGPVRTMDDLYRLIKQGVIRPRVYKIGDVQTADPFAETGLSLQERKKILMREFHTPDTGRRYDHRGCSERLEARLTERGEVVFRKP